MLEIKRRSFIQGIIAFCSAPAIIRAESLMPVKAPKLIVPARLPLFVLAEDAGAAPRYVVIDGVRYTAPPALRMPNDAAIYKDPRHGPYSRGTEKRYVVSDASAGLYEVVDPYKATRFRP